MSNIYLLFGKDNFGVIEISKFIVKHSPHLCGTIEISGSKNSALPVMAACIMTGSEVCLKNVPDISDIADMESLLKFLGCKCSFCGGVMCINSSCVKSVPTPYEISSRLRASFLVAGPLLALFGKARISLPGGCSIGQRPVDLHVRGFETLGAVSEHGNGYVSLAADALTGAEIYLDFPSVGATQNLMMAACLAKGQTVISNAAAEPEIADLGEFLNKCGAKIHGAGTDTVIIDGTEKLHGCEHEIIPDRIEAGTFMAAVAATHGRAQIKNVTPAHVKPITAKLSEMGVEFAEEINSVTVDARNKICGVSVRTMPYPGFPTDMQSQLTALLCTCEGTSSVTETVFENRFAYAGELVRMNAKIRIDGRCAVIDGVGELCGAKVSAADLRGGAALIIAALGAQGTTEIENAHFVRRGYDGIENKLKNIGADIYTE